MLILPVLVVVILFGRLHHAEDILYGCAELFWNFIVKRNSQLILEVLDGSLIRFRRDVSVPTTFSLLCALCDWSIIPTPGLARMCTRTNVGRATLWQTFRMCDGTPA